MILLTLNHSAIPNETPTVPTAQYNPPMEIVTSTGLLFASLLISLLAAFIAMLGKQWLNRYLRHAGGSMIERCGDRQRKCDGLQSWPVHLIVESLPVLLQIALLLLACGLCRYMVAINTPVAYTLIVLTGFGVLFYVGIVVAGASSYDCPFQTPGSALLRRAWTRVGPPLTSIFFLVINALSILGRIIWGHISVVWLAFVQAHRHFLTLLERIQLGILHIGFSLPPIGLDFTLPRIGLNTRRRFRNAPLPTTQEGLPSPNPQETIPWFAPNELATIEKKNTDNARCVSWVLKNITDPEALDAAIRLAGTIRWFERGIDVKRLYDLFIFTFDSCFGSDGTLHQGLENRAYYSGRAILWIHTLAVCKSEEFAHAFSFPTRDYGRLPSHHDFGQLLYVFQSTEPYDVIIKLLINYGRTHPHLQWTSSVLLHLSWVTRNRPCFVLGFRNSVLRDVDAGTPLDIVFNLLLMCCNLLGSPVEEHVLKLQDKSYGVSDHCSSSYSYHCSLAIARSRSSDKCLRQLVQPQRLPTPRSFMTHYAS